MEGERGERDMQRETKRKIYIEIQRQVIYLWFLPARLPPRITNSGIKANDAFLKQVNQQNINSCHWILMVRYSVGE